MKHYLLYCILPAWGNKKPPTLSGVENHPVFLVSKNELTAAVSGITPGKNVPDIPRVLAYKRVVDFFYCDQTVIPMRYGCVFEGKSQVRRFLKDHGSRCKNLLEEVNGCVEMGIRILVPEGTGSKSKEAICREAPAGSGRAFLTSRKAFYAQHDLSSETIKRFLDDCRNRFEGLYVKCKTETDSALHPPPPLIASPSPFSNPLLASLYFLVPRDAVESFRQTFRQISEKAPAKLLLSGPWPPYSFVTTDPFRNRDCDERIVKREAATSLRKRKADTLKGMKREFQP